MTLDHLTAIIKAAEARKDDKGWWTTQEGRHITLYAASGGSSLTVSRGEALRAGPALVAAPRGPESRRFAPTARWWRHGRSAGRSITSRSKTCSPARWSRRRR